MKIINKSEFDSVIAQGVVLVDFFATWCGPVSYTHLDVYKRQVPKYCSVVMRLNCIRMEVHI